MSANFRTRSDSRIEVNLRFLHLLAVASLGCAGFSRCKPGDEILINRIFMRYEFSVLGDPSGVVPGGA